MFITIPINLIDPSPYQPRKQFNEQAIEELASSIKEHGLIQPISVRSRQGRYELIAGERRLRAMKLLNYQEVAVLVLDKQDEEARNLAIIENIQRENLSPIEEAKAYMELLAIRQISQEELGRSLGKSQSFIANKIRLLKLSTPVIKSLENKEITERHARAMISLDSKIQIKLLNQVKDEKLNVAKLEQKIKKLKPQQFKAISKDLRIGINTIKQSYQTLLKYNVKATMKEEELEDTYRIIIDIRK